MVAVLVDSRQVGESAWVATRGLRKVSVAGTAGCMVRLVGREDGEFLIVTDCDGEFELPEGIEFVKAEHTETNSKSRVFVDLVR